MPIGLSVTVQNVLDRLNLQFSDTSDGKFSQAEKLSFIHQAVDYAWPLIKNLAVFNVNPLVSGTLTYTPVTNGNVPPWGYSTAHVVNQNGERVLLRRVTQYRNGTNFTVVVPDELTRLYDGEIMYMQIDQKYVLNNPPVLTDTIYIPLDYLWKAASYFLCLATLPKSVNFDVKPYEQLALLYKREADDAKQAYRSGDLPHTIPIVQDLGLGEQASYNPNGLYVV